MLRASTAGLIDFSQFDPWDMWWWKKLKWVFNELELQSSKEINTIQHAHWMALVLRDDLEDTTFKQVQKNAATAMNRVLQANYPWLAEQIGEDDKKTDVDAMVAAYEEIIGKPGEPRYEIMVAEMRALEKKQMRERAKQQNSSI